MDTKQQASKTMNQAAEKGKETAEEIKKQGAAATDQGKNNVSLEMSRIGGALHDASARLRQQNDIFADWTESIALRADRASSYLRDKSPAEVIDAAQDFSRRNPAFALGLMFLSGFALARFLRAGSMRSGQEFRKGDFQ